MRTPLRRRWPLRRVLTRNIVDAPSVQDTIHHKDTKDTKGIEKQVSFYAGSFLVSGHTRPRTRRVERFGVEERINGVRKVGQVG